MALPPGEGPQPDGGHEAGSIQDDHRHLNSVWQKMFCDARFCFEMSDQLRALSSFPRKSRASCGLEALLFLGKEERAKAIAERISSSSSNIPRTGKPPQIVIDNAVSHRTISSILEHEDGPSWRWFRSNCIEEIEKNVGAAESWFHLGSFGGGTEKTDLVAVGGGQEMDDTEKTDLVDAPHRKWTFTGSFSTTSPPLCGAAQSWFGWLMAEPSVVWPGHVMYAVLQEERLHHGTDTFFFTIRTFFRRGGIFWATPW